METLKKKFTQSLTFKGITIVLLVFILLIPGAMIQNLIQERQKRSHETVQIINDKWSRSQTLCVPLLLIPYTTTNYDKDYRHNRFERRIPIWFTRLRFAWKKLTSDI
jgi:inner membrane protein